jgi:hypothetical protein
VNLCAPCLFGWKVFGNECGIWGFHDVKPETGGSVSGTAAGMAWANTARALPSAF